jgi:hypothetical protein
MKPEVSISVLSSGKEWVRTIRVGSFVACSLITHKEDLDDYPLNGVRTLPKPETVAEKKARKEEKAKTPNSVPAGPDDDHPFKVGDKVMYDGQKSVVTRAYYYKGKPLCILDGKRQVSAKSLVVDTVVDASLKKIKKGLKKKKEK